MARKLFCTRDLYMTWHGEKKKKQKRTTIPFSRSADARGDVARRGGLGVGQQRVRVALDHVQPERARWKEGREGVIVTYMQGSGVVVVCEEGGMEKLEQYRQ